MFKFRGGSWNWVFCIKYKDVESDSFSNSPNVAVPVCWSYPPSKFITLACLCLLKVFMRIVERFHFCSTVEGKSSVKIVTPGALGFSFPFNGMRLLFLVCLHVLKWLLYSNCHYWEEDDCRLAIGSLGPATCLARKHGQVGFTSFKCHYSKDFAQSVYPEMGETPQRTERWMAGLDECPG